MCQNIPENDGLEASVENYKKYWEDMIIRNHEITTSRVFYKWLQNIIKGSPRGHLGILVG